MGITFLKHEITIQLRLQEKYIKESFESHFYGVSWLNEQHAGKAAWLANLTNEKPG